MSDKIPCENCITLSICKSTTSFLCYTLYMKCSLFRDWYNGKVVQYDELIREMERVLIRGRLNSA